MALRAVSHRTTPVCDSEWLEYTINGRIQRVAVESSAWYEWLHNPVHTAFAFMCSSGTFTARREQRRARSYWYAYRKKAGKIGKVYLGSAEQLTLERLIRAAATLANQPSGAMPTPLLHTKLNIPPVRSGFVSRLSAFTALKQVLPLTVVSASAGFGKTTLIAEWARTQPYPLAWLTLDSHDNEPSRFWSYILTALHAVAPLNTTEALALMHAPLAIDLAHVLTTLINNLTRLTQPLTLVLDDYHTINNQAIHTQLIWLIDHAPQSFQLVLISRTEPPMPFARWRAAGQLNMILVDALRFNQADMQRFFHITMQLDLADDMLASLAARTEGWIAGLQLAALSLRGQPELTISAGLDSSISNQRALFDYFSQEVLQQQPSVVQQFLLQTAILDQLCEPLCAAVVDRAMPAGMLDYLERSNVFVVALDHKHHWYRYHQLFRESLLQQAKQQLGADAIAQLHRRASCWFEQAEHPAEAINHALAAADFERAGRLLATIGFSWLWRGESAMVKRWLHALPATVIEHNAYLCCWSAWILVEHDQLAACTYYLNRISELRTHMTAEAAESSIIDGHLKALQASIARRRSDMPTVSALTHQALKALPPDSAMLRSTITRNLCAGYIISGDTVAAEVALHQALREQELLEAHVASDHRHPSERQHAQTIRLLLWIETTSLRWLQGQFHAAADLYRQTLHLSRERHQHPVSAIACVNLGQISRQWNKLAEAREYLQQGIAYSLKVGADITRRNGLIELARIHQAHGEPEQAQSTMAQAVALARTFPSTRGLLWATTWQARLQLAQGDLAAATRWAQEYQRQANPFPQFNLYDAEDLTLARVLIAQGQLQQASTLLEHLLPTYQAAGRLPSVIEVYLLQALKLAAQQDWSDASRMLIQALSLAQPEGYMRLFIDEGPAVTNLLERIEPQVQPVLRPYVQRLLVASDRCGSSIPQMPSPTYPLIEPLSERELTVIRLLAAGFSNQEIAQRLIVTLNTIKTHLKNIYGKLAVTSRTQAIARARSLNLISSNP